MLSALRGGQATMPSATDAGKTETDAPKARTEERQADSEDGTSPEALPVFDDASAYGIDPPEVQGFNYYDAFTKQLGYCEEVMQNLLSGFDAGEMGTMPLMEALHTVENDADAVNHEIRRHLIIDEKVPLKRRALLQLAESMETATDAIEDIAIAAYIYGARHLQDPMHDVLEHMAASSTLLKEAFARLDDYARYQAGILSRLQAVSEHEIACDHLFVRSMHALYSGDAIVGEDRQITATLYQKLEDAMDSLQHIGESIEAVISQLRE